MSWGRDFFPLAQEADCPWEKSWISGHRKLTKSTKLTSTSSRFLFVVVLVKAFSEPNCELFHSRGACSFSYWSFSCPTKKWSLIGKKKEARRIGENWQLMDWVEEAKENFLSIYGDEWEERGEESQATRQFGNLSIILPPTHAPKCCSRFSTGRRATFFCRLSFKIATRGRKDDGRP